MIVPAVTQLAPVLLCGLFGGCVTGNESAGREGAALERAVSGRPIFMQQTYMTIDRRCRALKRATAVVTRTSDHGTVRMRTRKAAAVYGPGDYAHCDGKIGNSLAFAYTSKPNYRGRDAFEIRVRYADGETRQARFDIAVE